MQEGLGAGQQDTGSSTLAHLFAARWHADCNMQVPCIMWSVFLHPSHVAPMPRGKKAVLAVPYCARQTPKHAQKDRRDQTPPRRTAREMEHSRGIGTAT